MSYDGRMTEITALELEPEREGPGRFLAGLHIFNIILNWLAGLVQLTREEQKQAGIYFRDQRVK